jgi:DNA invertase Pin-like site-specific DNA recombinase
MNDTESNVSDPMSVTIKYVAYYRVSTKRQGKSGLGLEAQKEMVLILARQNGAIVIAEYIEVETGKKSARPKLHEAIRHAKLANATLVVAKLDRLARNSYFTNCLLHSKLDFICCDNPYATKFNIQILAAVAEHEADQISARTKGALAVAKSRGKLLGSSRPGHWVGREDRRQLGLKKAQMLGVTANSQAARDRYTEVIVPHIKSQREAGKTLEQIVEWLNAQGFTTRKTKRAPNGSAFTISTVYRLIQRYLDGKYLGYPGSALRPVAAVGA